MLSETSRQLITKGLRRSQSRVVLPSKREGDPPGPRRPWRPRLKISSTTPPITPPTAEAAEGPGPEIRNDGDGDDAAAKASPRPALPPGQGVIVDKSL